MKKTLAILILSIVLGSFAPASARAESSPARSSSTAAAAETDETPAKETEAETDEAPARETEAETEKTPAKETEAPATCEGPGFDTQEEAVCAYVESFVRGDFDGMLAACAVETYVDKLDLEKQIERQGVLITPPNAAGYLLPGDAMARALNIEARRGMLVRIMTLQYLTAKDSTVMSAQTSGGYLPLRKEMTAADLLEDYYQREDPELEFTGMLVPPSVVTDRYFTSQLQLNLAKAAWADGADVESAMGVVLYADEEPYYLCLGTVRFDGRWYVSTNNVLAMVLDLNHTGGMYPVEELGLTAEQVAAIYEEYLADGRLLALTAKAEDAIAGIDRDEIFSLPMEEQKAAFEQAYYDAVTGGLTDEEIGEIEQSSSMLQ